MIAPHDRTDKPQALRDLADQLLASVRDAAAQGIPAHEVERASWQRILALGHTALAQFCALQGAREARRRRPRRGA